MGDLTHRYTQTPALSFREGMQSECSCYGADELRHAPSRLRSFAPPRSRRIQMAPTTRPIAGRQNPRRRQNSKVGDHHFTRAHLQFELSDPLHTGLARYKLVKPAEDRRQAARRSHVRKIITDRTCNLPKLDRRLWIVRAYGKDDRQGAIVASAQNHPVVDW